MSLVRKKFSWMFAKIHGLLWTSLAIITDELGHTNVTRTFYLLYERRAIKTQCYYQYASKYFFIYCACWTLAIFISCEYIHVVAHYIFVCFQNLSECWKNKNKNYWKRKCQAIYRRQQVLLEVDVNWSCHRNVMLKCCRISCTYFIAFIALLCMSFLGEKIDKMSINI